MVIAADSSSPNTTTAAANNSPRKNLPSPWAQVVRGADSEPLHHQSLPSSSSSTSSLSADSDSSDADKANNAGALKKPAWKMPPSDVAEVSPVMGAVSWPALSEAAKLSVKPTSDSSTTDGSLSTTQGPVTPHSPQTQANSNSNVKPSPAMNTDRPNRQRSTKQGGSNSNGPAPVRGNFTNTAPNLSPSPPLPPPPPFPVLQIPSSSFTNGVPCPSPRDPFRNHNWDTRSPVGGFGPPMNEQRSPSRRGNFGHHPRGANGPHHNNYDNRRDQERLNYANSRDARAPQQRMSPRGLMRFPPPNAAPPFMGPQPLQPFLNPAGFPEFYYFPTLQLESFGRMPFFTHAPPPAMFFPVAETPLTDVIIKQIDYYFSDTNLVKDNYLRSNMDEQGWVPITLIANFPRVKSLTNNVELILDSLKTSSVVEVQGDKLRKRDDWIKWLPSTQREVDSSSMSTGESNYNNIAGDFEKITLNEALLDKVNSDPTTNGEAIESSDQSQFTIGDAAKSCN